MDAAELAALAAHLEDHFGGKFERILATKLDEWSAQHRAAQDQILTAIHGLQGHNCANYISEKRKSERHVPAESSHASLIHFHPHIAEKRLSRHTNESRSPALQAENQGHKVQSFNDLETSLLKDIAHLTVRKVASRASRKASLSDGAAASGSVKAFRSTSATPAPPAKLKPVDPEEDACGPSILPNEPSVAFEDSKERLKPRKVLLPKKSNESLQVDSPRLRTFRSESCASPVVTMDDMNRDSQHAIIEGSANDSGDEESKEVEWDIGSRILLRFPCAIQLLVALPALIHTAIFVVLKILGSAQRVNYTFTMVASVLYGLVGTLGAHLLVKSLRSNNFNMAMSRLHMFVADWRVYWADVSMLECRRYALAWVIMVFCYAATQLMDAYLLETGQAALDLSRTFLHVMEVTSTVSFAITSAIVLMVAFVQSHLLLGLDKSLDCWCNAISLEPDFGIGTTSWNCLQALLKYVGRELASSFVTVQVLGAIGFIFFLASAVAFVFRTDIEALPMLVEAMSSLPLLFLFSLNLRIFANAAALTEKCRSIPAFVNQIPSEDYLDMERQYLVRFISDSSPGFFVRDIRLTQEMFLKQFLLVGGLLSGLFGVLSRVV